jgi:hypothetical protein
MMGSRYVKGRIKMKRGRRKKEAMEGCLVRGADDACGGADQYHVQISLQYLVGSIYGFYSSRRHCSYYFLCLLLSI